MTSFQFIQGQTVSNTRHSARLRMGLLIVGPIILCAAVAFLASTLMPTIYAARAEILFQSLQQEDVTESYKATQTVIATGPAVLGAAAETLRVPIEQMQAAFTVAFPKSGTVMQLQFTDRDPATAVSRLNVILDRYLLTLGTLDTVNRATYSLLVPPFLLDDPIQPRPVQALILGLIVGLAISLGAFALVRRSRDAR